MRHPVGAHTYSWMWRAPVQPALASLAGLGFDEFELMAMSGHLWPAEMDAAARRELRDWASGEGLVLRSINHPGVDHNLCSPVPEMRAYTVAMYAGLIGLVADLGCTNLIVLSGRVNPLLPAPMARYREWAFEGIQQLLPLARDRGVVLTVENVPIGPVRTAADMADMIRRLDSPAVRACYDSANAHFIGEDLAAGVRLLAPLLDLVHLCDTPRDAWKHDAVGDGTVDFAAMLVAVREIGFARKPLLELCVADPEAGHRQSVRNLSGLI
ncbi:MAG: sugar phosphate isomerase/epimerase family protein [Bordetella sp.]|nr:sugar phosphate isomerase/epimerase family protein [Bordetella sp.]